MFSSMAITLAICSRCTLKLRLHVIRLEINEILGVLKSINKQNGLNKSRKNKLTPDCLWADVPGTHSFPPLVHFLHRDESVPRSH